MHEAFLVVSFLSLFDRHPTVVNGLLLFRGVLHWFEFVGGDGAGKSVSTDDMEVDSNNDVIAVESCCFRRAARYYIFDFGATVVTLIRGDANPYLIGLEFLFDSDSCVSEILFVRDRFLAADVLTEDCAE